MLNSFQKNSWFFTRIVTKYIFRLTFYISALFTFHSSSEYALSNNLSIPSVAKRATDSVVKIWGPGSQGSGVMVLVPESDGTGSKIIIITAHHVVDNLGKNELIEVQIPGGKILEIESSNINVIKNHDLAVISSIKFKEELKGIRAAKIGNSNLLKRGDEIIVAGYPIIKDSNVSNDVRINKGIVQTYTYRDNKRNLIGYSAKTFPGMSGGGIFSMDGKLLFIHLKGEQEIWDQIEASTDKIRKSGTNFGISVLMVLEELNREALNEYKNNSALSEFQKGLFLVRSNNPRQAFKVFDKLRNQYPSSLVAEWNAACLELEMKIPQGAPSLENDTFPYHKYTQFTLKRQKEREVFYSKYNKNPYYGIPFTSDSHIWDNQERLEILADDPIYNLAKQVDEYNLSIKAQGSLIRLNLDKDKCEKIVGLRKYIDRDLNEILYWDSIPNPGAS